MVLSEIGESRCCSAGAKSEISGHDSSITREKSNPLEKKKKNKGRKKNNYRTFWRKGSRKYPSEKKKISVTSFLAYFSMDVSFLLEKARLIVSLKARWFVYTMYSKPK